jgi:hypothetical protein
MKTYQSVLPAAMRKLCQADRTRKRHLAHNLKTRIAEIFTNGFWFCLDCEARCERVESDQGQPAGCDRCGSPRIEWNKPVWLLEPGDLAGKEAA